MTTATLTLSKVERAAVEMHLQVQHNRLDPLSPDALVMEGLMNRLRVQIVTALSRMEAVILLRYLRKQVSEVTRDLMDLEERRIRTRDPTLDAAYHALSSDQAILTDVIKRLWDIVI
jgi:hypothetical protein